MSDYETFYHLHHQTQPLLLANAWNTKSAKLIEEAGFQAVATSSGAISNSMGYDDGEKMPFSELMYIIKRIQSVITIPLSVDLERGYTDDLSSLVDNVQQLLEAGVAGINLEDAQGEELYLHKLNAVRNHLEKNNQKLFINSRTDGFLQKIDSPFETIIKRAALYKDAGANGLFVTAVGDPGLIKQIASSVNLPLNVVGNSKLATVAELSACGVRRISMAVHLYRKTYQQMEYLVKEVAVQQSLAPLF